MDKNDYLQTMGIQAWETKAQEKTKDLTPLPESLTPLRERVSSCTLCSLHQTRTQTVFGVGHPQADLMIIGEAPGFNEDKQGEPFAGPAGQLLNEILAAIGLKRERVFITNILKCRPPNNRDPQPNEVESCTPYLAQQIDLIQPKLIVAVGRIAAQFLTNTSSTLSNLRNKSHHYQATPLIATYHPAYLLRSPQEKANAWLDWKNIAGKVSSATPRATKAGQPAPS